MYHKYMWENQEQRAGNRNTSPDVLVQMCCCVAEAAAEEFCTTGLDDKAAGIDRLGYTTYAEVPTALISQI